MAERQLAAMEERALAAWVCSPLHQGEAAERRLNQTAHVQASASVVARWTLARPSAADAPATTTDS